MDLADITRRLESEVRRADELYGENMKLRAGLMEIREMCEDHPNALTNVIDELARVALAPQRE